MKFLFLLIFLISLVNSGEPKSEGLKYLLIVNEKSPIVKLSNKEVKKIFSGKITIWEDTKINPSYADSKTKTGKYFFDKILRIKPDRFKKHWLRKVLSGSGSAPLSFDDVGRVIEHISKTPGGVGVVTENLVESLKGCKIIKKY